MNQCHKWGLDRLLDILSNYVKSSKSIDLQMNDNKFDIFILDAYQNPVICLWTHFTSYINT